MIINIGKILPGTPQENLFVDNIDHYAQGFCQCALKGINANQVNMDLTNRCHAAALLLAKDHALSAETQNSKKEYSTEVMQYCQSNIDKEIRNKIDSTTLKKLSPERKLRLILLARKPTCDCIVSSFTKGAFEGILHENQLSQAEVELVAANKKKKREKSLEHSESNHCIEEILPEAKKKLIEEIKTGSKKQSNYSVEIPYHQNGKPLPSPHTWYED
jgi:hypothetical protein